jgi:hypothetical protein
MDAYFAQLPLLTHLTLQLRFLRANGKEFFLIVDNVDQLAVTVQRGVLDYVVFLASGSQMIAASAAKQGGFPVLFSARHETLEVLGVPPRTTTQMIYVGRVSPPRMDRVFESRFVPLLHGFEADILQKKQSTLALLANSAIAEASARALASTWVKVVTTQRLAEYVHRLTGYNTRVTLNVLANFVASGHLEPDGLNEDHHIQKALILGPQRWYNSRTAWLHNLFADRFSDELSCVLTVWILASFEARRGKGVAAARVAERFHMALGIEIERVLERCSEIREYGLLEAAEDDGTLALSPTGKRYLQLVSSNFDYLQHVITDTPVGVEYWEPCAPSHDGLADRAGRSDKDRDEGVEARLRRVVKFAAWVNTVECRTYARAIARNRAAELRAELASESLTSRLVSALSVCMQVNRWYRFHDLQREVRAISETASFDVIEIKARALLEATER